MIHADRVIGDDLQAGVQLGYNVGVKYLGMTGNNCVNLCTHAYQIIAGAECVIRVKDDVVILLSTRLGVCRELAAYPESRLI